MQEKEINMKNNNDALKALYLSLIISVYIIYKIVKYIDSEHVIFIQ